MNNSQIEELAVQYQRAINNVDFCIEKFKNLGLNPDQYLHQRESYVVKKSKSVNMRERLAALKLKHANMSSELSEDSVSDGDTMMDDCSHRQERAHSAPEFKHND